MKRKKINPARKRTFIYDGETELLRESQDIEEEFDMDIQHFHDLSDTLRDEEYEE